MYVWRPGAMVKTSAETVGAICEQMASEGRLTARNLVDDSRPEDAPLHREFEWDDTAAAENWRTQQARNIINHLEVKIEQAQPVSAFIKIMNSDRQYYQTELAIQHKDTREIILANALRELEAFQRKYAAFSELAEIFAAIEKIEASA